MTSHSKDSDLVRILRRLSTVGGRLARVAGGSFAVHTAGRTATSAEWCDAALIEVLRSRGLIAATTDGFAINQTGRAFLRRALAGADGFTEQHQDRSKTVINDDSGDVITVTINHDESPLAWLRRRRGRDGRPLVDAAQYAAGERLRSDYTRGQLMPRVTANWTAAVADGARAGGVAELTEAAMGARRRVARALAATGPELGGLLVDFCCFLKGLEEIERERQWPARSAKVVLRLGLATLARHYGLAKEARGRQGSARATRHWGAADYRPAIE